MNHKFQIFHVKDGNFNAACSTTLTSWLRWHHLVPSWTFFAPQIYTINLYVTYKKTSKYIFHIHQFLNKGTNWNTLLQDEFCTFYWHMGNDLSILSVFKVLHVAQRPLSPIYFQGVIFGLMHSFIQNINSKVLISLRQ